MPLFNMKNEQFEFCTVVILQRFDLFKKGEINSDVLRNLAALIGISTVIEVIFRLLIDNSEL